MIEWCRSAIIEPATSWGLVGRASGGTTWSCLVFLCREPIPQFGLRISKLIKWYQLHLAWRRDIPVCSSHWYVSCLACKIQCKIVQSVRAWLPWSMLCLLSCEDKQRIWRQDHFSHPDLHMTFLVSIVSSTRSCPFQGNYSKTVGIILSGIHFVYHS